MERLVTGDESWVFQYDPETRRQRRQWVEEWGARPKQARMSKSKVKSMITCFFDIQGLVHKEFVPPNQTVKAVFYLTVLERLRQRVARVRPNLAAEGWILHHDNASAHSSLAVREFLAKKQIPVLPTPHTAPISLRQTFFSSRA